MPSAASVASDYEAKILAFERMLDRLTMKNALNSATTTVIVNSALSGAHIACAVK